MAPGRVIAINIATEDMLEILDETLMTLKKVLIGITDVCADPFSRHGLKIFTVNFDFGHQYFEPLPKPYFNSEGLAKIFERN